MGKQNPKEKSKWTNCKIWAWNWPICRLKTLKKLALPEDLYEAVREYKKITSNSAVKRQRQYIGRLMRDIDPTPIREFLAKLKGDNQAHNAFLQRVEQARTRLLANDDALTQFTPITHTPMQAACEL